MLVLKPDSMTGRIPLEAHRGSGEQCVTTARSAGKHQPFPAAPFELPHEALESVSADYPMR
jgi:hypothetical protein